MGLTRIPEVTPPEKVISDNLTHKPSLSSSSWFNYSQGLSSFPDALNTFDKEFSESPRGKTVASTYEALKRGNENPEVGWKQWGVNEISSMLGQATNPLNVLLAEAGGLAMKPLIAGARYIAPAFTRLPIKQLLAEPMAKYFPSTIGKEEAAKTLSLGLFGSELTKGFGIGVGASLPQATIDNFNAETGKHDITGMAKSLGYGGAFGMAFGTVPFAWGILKANFNRARGMPIDTPIEPQEVDKAVDDGHFNKEQAQFIKDLDDQINHGNTITLYTGEKGDQPSGYLWKTLSEARKYTNGKDIDFHTVQITPEDLEEHFEDSNPDTFFSHYRFMGKLEEWDNIINKISKKTKLFNIDKQRLKEKATRYIANEGHPVDHANDTAQFEILSKEQMNNLQSATLDRLVSNNIPEEHRSNLTNFTVQAGIDEMRDKPGILDGVRGYTEYADKNLAHKDEILAHADKVVDEHLNMPIEEKLPFDQESLLSIVKKHGKQDHIPFAVPEEVSERAKQEAHIERIERQNEKLFDQYERSGRNEFNDKMQENYKEIERLRNNLIPLKTAMQELQDIKEKLIPLKKNFKSSKEYARLQDLAEVWKPAKTLLDRVNLEDEINKQEAYRDLAKFMLKIVDSNTGKMADREKVNSYLESRTTERVDSEMKPKSDIKEVVKNNNVPVDDEAMIAEQDRLVEQAGLEHSSQEYEKAKEQYKEFKQSEGIFKNLINCVLGSQK